jgi:hypothetical protein
MALLFSPSRGGGRASIRSESQRRQGPRCIDVRRKANLSPPFRIRGARCFGLAYKLSGVAPQQEVCRQTITAASRRTTCATLSGSIARLVSPLRLRRIDRRAHARLILREEVGCVLVRARAPVRPNSAGFECAHLHPKRSHFPGNRLGESPPPPTWLHCIRRSRDELGGPLRTISEGCSRSFAFA